MKFRVIRARTRSKNGQYTLYRRCAPNCHHDSEHGCQRRDQSDLPKIDAPTRDTADNGQHDQPKDVVNHRRSEDDLASNFMKQSSGGKNRSGDSEALTSKPTPKRRNITPRSDNAFNISLG